MEKTRAQLKRSARQCNLKIIGVAGGLAFGGWLVQGAAAMPPGPPLGNPPSAAVPAVASGGSATAANNGPATSRPALQYSDVTRLYLMDGSTISGKLLIPSVIIETKYGKLEIPVSDIIRFTPGLASHPEIAVKISNAIEKLGDDDFAQREAAQKALLELGSLARGELQKHVADPESERSSRVQAILEQMDEMADEESDSEAAPQETIPAEDQVQTLTFTAAGKISQRSFEIQSPYGPLTVKINDIHRFQRDSNMPQDTLKSVTVTAAANVAKGLEGSKIIVARGDVITVNASGTLTMTPWGNNATSTPDGAPNYGQFVNGIPAGALIGKIGKGPPFKLGSKETITADRSGELELGIGLPQGQDEAQFPGEYEVKIRVHKK